MLTYEIISENIKTWSRAELLAGKVVIVRGSAQIPIRGVRRITYPSSMVVFVDALDGEMVQIQEGDEIIISP